MGLMALGMGQTPKHTGSFSEGTWTIAYRYFIKS